MNLWKKVVLCLVRTPATVEEPDAVLSITDALGRDVLQLKVGKQTELDVQGLSKGIYWVRARDNLKTIFQTLVIE